jgi:hypothetical protein
VLLAEATVAVALCTAPLLAQDDSALEVAVTYNAMRGGSVPNANFWMQGGSIELQARFYRGLGVVAEIASAHATNIQSSGVGLGLVTTTFGPRYNWAPAHQSYEFFAQVLAGEANGFNSVIPTTNAAIDSSNSLALKMGGGMNITLSRRIALRAFEANWLRTQIPNATTNIQNNLDLGAGLVFRFR